MPLFRLHQITFLEPEISLSFSLDLSLGTRYEMRVILESVHFSLIYDSWYRTPILLIYSITYILRTVFHS